MLDSVFQPFIDKSPISVIARGLLEQALESDETWSMVWAHRDFSIHQKLVVPLISPILNKF